MILRLSYGYGRVAAVGCALLFGNLSAANATGPDNQVVPNPAPGGTNTLSSVVAVDVVNGGKIVNGGTGTVINSFVLQSTNVGYLCILTADHVVTAGANKISFPNVTLGAAPPAQTFDIVGSRQIAGLNALQNVDANVLVVKYGTPDAFWFGVQDKSLTNSVGVGQTLAEVGMGVSGTANFVGGNLTSITQSGSATFGTKRYQNNLLTAFVADNPHGIYRENDVTYTFDAQGTANFTAGEGFGFPGDSGAPLFNGGGTFNPGTGLPLVAATDFIAGIDVFGPVGTITNGAVESTVDVFDYRNNIMVACNTLQSLVTPEPGSMTLFAGLLVSGSVFARRRLRRRALSA